MRKETGRDAYMTNQPRISYCRFSGFAASVIVAGTLFGATSPSCASARTFYLDLGSAENGDGGQMRPFNSFEAAQKAVRRTVSSPQTSAGRVTVKISSGRHFLPSSVIFSEKDSGSLRNPIVWQAVNGGGVRLSGGRDLPPLSPVTDENTLLRLPAVARGHVLEADLAAAGIVEKSPACALVWGDGFLEPARWPNDGVTTIQALKRGPDGKKVLQGQFVYADDHLSQWACEPDGFATGHFQFNWDTATIRIKKIDVATKTLFAGELCGGRDWGYHEGRDFFGFNLLCEIDRPGEYQYDRKNGKLRVWPPSGNPAEPPQLTVTETLIDFSGVSNVTFEGVVFENARGTAIRARDCTSLNFIRCTFQGVEQAGDFSNYRNSRIAGCDIRHCARGGFHLTGGDEDEMIHSGLIVENCDFRDYAHFDPSYRPAINLLGCGSLVRRNLFHEGPHAAIIFKGREHRILNNEIHSVCRQSGEMGAVYCGRDLTLCGNVIAGNYFHDINSKRTQTNRAIMLDDAAAGLTIVSNRFLRVSEGVSLSGLGNRVEKNLFAESYPAICGWETWHAPSSYDWFVKNSEAAKMLLKLNKVVKDARPWVSRYPYLVRFAEAVSKKGLRAKEDIGVVAGNVVVDGPDDAFMYAWQTHVYPDDWRIDGNIRSADGKEADAFLPAMSEIGVYESTERATWPVPNPCDEVTGLHIVHAKHYRVLK